MIYTHVHHCIINIYTHTYIRTLICIVVSSLNHQPQWSVSTNTVLFYNFANRLWITTRGMFVLCWMPHQDEILVGLSELCRDPSKMEAHQSLSLLTTSR